MREAGDRDGKLNQHQDDHAGADPVGRARAWLERVLGDRPLSVYGVLAAGVLVLVVLLAIIWITATGGNGDDAADTQCFEITVEEAQVTIERGEVAQVRITTAQEGPELPIAALLELTDQSCRYLPEGAANRNGMLLVLGAADFFNRNRSADERIRIRYLEQANVPPEVLATATPTATVGPSETPLPPTAPPASPTAAPPPPTAPPSPPAPAMATPIPAATEAASPPPLPTGGALQTEVP